MLAAMKTNVLLEKILDELKQMRKDFKNAQFVKTVIDEVSCKEYKIGEIDID